MLLLGQAYKEASNMTRKNLSSLQVLVVEDEYFLAEELAQSLRAAGADVLGPLPEPNRALKLLATGVSPHAAVLDINLRGDDVYPLAEELRRKRIPFVFATGYDQGSIPAQYADVPRCQKPLKASEIISALKSLGVQ
jgi:CheY-like chemotaxis protein